MKPRYVILWDLSGNLRSRLSLSSVWCIDLSFNYVARFSWSAHSEQILSLGRAQLLLKYLNSSQISLPYKLYHTVLVLLQCLDYVVHMQMLQSACKKQCLFSELSFLTGQRRRSVWRKRELLSLLSWSTVQENEIILESGSGCATAWPWHTARQIARASPVRDGCSSPALERLPWQQIFVAFQNKLKN